MFFLKDKAIMQLHGIAAEYKYQNQLKNQETKCSSDPLLLERI
jgi:hypothetical protein